MSGERQGAAGLAVREGFARLAWVGCAFRGRVDEFDILVTDTPMPGLSGPDLIQEVRALRAGLPVELLSGYMRPDDAEKARRMGITNVLLKPHTASDLADVLHRTIRDQSR